MLEKKSTDRRSLRTRRWLQKALLDLMREKPYHKITISEIAKRAEVARPTFYAHFETKEDLLLSHIDDVVESIDGKIEEELERPHRPDATLPTSFFEQWLEHADTIRLILSAGVDHFIMKRFQRHVKEQYARGIEMAIAPPVNPVLAGYVIDYLAGAMHMVFTRWVKEGMQQPPEVMGRLVQELIFPGVWAIREGELNDMVV
jgi:AcrR family transcriptional regulator